MRKESDAEIFNCIICKEDRNYFSIGQCEHRKVCNYCSLRSRILYKDKRCPICTAKLENVFIYESTERPSFAEMEANKYYFYEDDDFADNGIYYSTVSAKEEALKLKSFICPLKSCPEGAFDNLQTLCNHISKTHKRETCLKEGKKFLSEMKIYNYETLNEHVAYGEYSEKGSLVIPPHPMCGFCNIKFYNDEHLFKHMNEHHFICQLCRDKKNIVFYKEISQLLDHYKDRHFVCAYQECLEDMFVVFESEEKLNSHLVTKHKCQDAQNRLTSFHVTDKRKTDTVKNFQTKQGKYNSREEFNFTMYIDELKERVKDYIKNFSQRQSQNSYSDYKNGGDFENDGLSSKQGYGNSRGGRQNDNAYYNSNEHYNEQSEYNSEYARGGKNKSRQRNTKGNYNQNYNQGNEQNYDDQGYNQNFNQGRNQNDNQNYNQGHNQKPNQGEQNYYNKNDYYQSNNTNEGPHKNRDKNINSKFNTVPSDPYQKHTHSSQTNIPSTSNKNYPASNKLQQSPKIDYSFIFNSVVKIVKDYIIQKIQKENPAEEDFIVPKETIYQLIVIIDKLDNEKLLELTSLTNFGIDLDVHRELKRIISFMDGAIVESVCKLLNQLEVRKVLIVYKYFATAQKKIDGLFYKLELEQIDSDLYEDFAFRRKPKKQNEVSQVKKNPPKENKIRLTNDIFPNLKGNKPEAEKDGLNDIPFKGKLNSIFERKCAVTNDNKNQNKINLNSNYNNTTQASNSAKGNKLTTLFDNKANPVPKKEVLVLNKKKLNKNAIKYDEDFPEL